MDAEIIVSALIQKFNENKPTVVHHSMFGNPIQTAIKNLELLKAYLEKCHPMDVTEMARLLKAVYSAEDAMDDLLTSIQLQRKTKREISPSQGDRISMEKEELKREEKELRREKEELRREKEELKREEKELRRSAEESQIKEEELRKEKEELHKREKELQIKREELGREKEEKDLENDSRMKYFDEQIDKAESTNFPRTYQKYDYIAKIGREKREYETIYKNWQNETAKKEFSLEVLLGENKERQRVNEELQRENKEFQRRIEEFLRENEDLQRDNENFVRENEETLRDIEKFQKDYEEWQKSDENSSPKKEQPQTAREKSRRRKMDILGRKVFKRPLMCFKPLCCRVVFLRKMKKLKNEVEALCCRNDDKGSVVNNNDSGQHNQQQRWGKIFYFCSEENHGMGFEGQIMDLVRKLLPQKLPGDDGQLQQDPCHESPQPQVIKVTGVGGSGKTTLMRTLYNRCDMKLHFSIRAWVHVSSITKDRDLWIDLLKQIDPTKLVGEATFSGEEMVSRVTKLLKDTKYLIVIDQDDEKPYYWQTLTEALCSSSNRGKIVIITEDEHTIPSQEHYSTVKLVELKDEESWTLFSKKVGIATDDDPNIKSSLEIHKLKILSLCKGSPLRLIMLGGLLSTKKNGNYDDWLKAINPANYSEEDIWDLCYQDLPSQVKPCFLYMLLFPRGFEIPVRRLIHLWCAEGFLTSLARDDQEIEPEDLAEIYFEELVIRNMIQVRWRLDGSPKACRMHSALYNAFCQKATGLGFLYNQLHSSLRSTKQHQFVRRFATKVGTNNDFSSNPFFHVQHLRTYIAFDTRIQGTATIDTIMLLKRVMTKRGFRLLKVLDLEGVYKPRNIDIAVELFLCLSYLGLRSTFIDFLPGSVGDLKNLETLDLKHTRIHDIPCHVWNAKKLKHLYLSWINGVADVNSAPNQLLNLHTLWGLYWRHESSSVIESIGDSGRNIRKLGLAYNSSMEGGISELVYKLTSLQSLKLRCINDDGESEARYLTLKTMNEHQKLQELYLRGQLNPEFVSDAHFFPPNLKTLTLSMTRVEDDTMPVLGQLPHLNILRLFADSCRSKKMTCRTGGFPKLRVLKLWKLPLEQFTLEEEAMPCLQELEIRSCSDLKLIEGSEHLTSLNEIVLTNMPFYLLRSLTTKTGYVKRVKL